MNSLATIVLKRVSCPSSMQCTPFATTTNSTQVFLYVLRMSPTCTRIASRIANHKRQVAANCVQMCERLPPPLVRRILHAAPASLLRLLDTLSAGLHTLAIESRLQPAVEHAASSGAGSAVCQANSAAPAQRQHTLVLTAAKDMMPAAAAGGLRAYALQASRYSTVVELVICDTPLAAAPGACGALADVLRVQTQLQRLRIANVGLSSKTGPQIIAALSALQQLAVLDVSNNMALGDAGVCAVVGLPAASKRELTMLNLADTRLSSEGLRLLHLLVKSTPKLLHLDTTGTCEGVDHVIQTFPIPQALQCLRVDAARCRDQWRAASESTQLASLTSLHMASKRCTGKHYSQAWDALQASSRLASLHLDGGATASIDSAPLTHVTDFSWRIYQSGLEDGLAPAVCAMTQLRRLSILSAYDFTPETLRELRGMLPSLLQLTSLCISIITVDECTTEATAMLECLAALTALSHVRLEGFMHLPPDAEIAKCSWPGMTHLHLGLCSMRRAHARCGEDHGIASSHVNALIASMPHLHSLFIDGGLDETPLQLECCARSLKRLHVQCNEMSQDTVESLGISPALHLQAALPSLVSLRSLTLDNRYSSSAEHAIVWHTIQQLTLLTELQLYVEFEGCPDNVDRVAAATVGHLQTVSHLKHLEVFKFEVTGWGETDRCFQAISGLLQLQKLRRVALSVEPCSLPGWCAAVQQLVSCLPRLQQLDISRIAFEHFSRQQGCVEISNAFAEAEQAGVQLRNMHDVQMIESMSFE